MNFMAGEATFIQRFVLVFSVEPGLIVAGETEFFGRFNQQHFIVGAMGMVTGNATAILNWCMQHTSVQTKICGLMAEQAKSLVQLFKPQGPHHAVGLVAALALVLGERLVLFFTGKVTLLVTLGARPFL
jgi:hypothetical protein